MKAKYISAFYPLCKVMEFKTYFVIFAKLRDHGGSSATVIDSLTYVYTIHTGWLNILFKLSLHLSFIAVAIE